MRFLISGTSRGIGKSIAEELLKLGHIVIGIARSQPSISNPNYQHIIFDLSNIEKINELLAQLPEIDVLINSAAIANLNPFILQKNDDLIKIFNTNFLSSLIITKEVVRNMIYNKYGRVINISSIATVLKPKGEASYTISKTALESMSPSLSKELHAFGITINNIRVSLAKTDLLKSIPSEEIGKIKSNLSHGEFISSQEIMNTILFLISDEAKNITGQTIGFGGI